MRGLGNRAAERPPHSEAQQGWHELPHYATMLAAYHAAHAQELRAMIGNLRLQPGDYVLDIGCGPGTYTCLLERHREELGLPLPRLPL